jgi:hypothetical protein
MGDWERARLLQEIREEIESECQCILLTVNRNGQYRAGGELTDLEADNFLLLGPSCKSTDGRVTMNRKFGGDRLTERFSSLVFRRPCSTPIFAIAASWSCIRAFRRCATVLITLDRMGVVPLALFAKEVACRKIRKE